MGVADRTATEIHPFKMDFKILAVFLFAFAAAAEASVISDFLRPVAYAALEDVAESDWDKESSAVVQKEEEEEDTELVEEDAGEERSFPDAAFAHLAGLDRRQ